MIGRAFHAGLGALRKYAAVLLLLVGAGMLYVFVSAEFWSIVGPIAGVVIGSALAVLATVIGAFWHREGGGTTTPEPLDPRVPVVLACSYVIAILVLFRFNTYQRPDLLYVLFGGYAGLIGYQIARGAGRTRIVPQIAVLAFFTYWSSQFLFPAGMYGPDTHYRYVPVIRDIFDTARIPASEVTYAGHLAYVTEFAYLSGLPAELGYYLIATLVLTGTVLLLGMLDRVFPAIPDRVALYGALLFSVMGWMIGRGMHPNKLNFFYPMLLCVGFAAVKIFQAGTDRHTEQRGWLLVGFVTMPALVFGHRFSAGAGLVLMLVFGGYALLSRTVLSSEYETVPEGSPFAFILIYAIAIMGNPLHQGPILRRVTGLVLSIFVSTGAASPPDTSATAGGGPGRYSGLPLDVLMTSTASQTILFSLTILGAIWAFRQSEWEYDYVLVWMGGISLLLVVSILTNSADTAPQRFYALLGLFGFNVCAGALFHLVERTGQLSIGSVEITAGRGVVPVLFCILAVASLASPIADRATSPVNDELPHFRQFSTAQLEQGQQWERDHTTGSVSRMIPPETDVPIERTGRVTGRSNMSVLNESALYSYSSLAQRTGLVYSSSLSIGGREFLFVGPPDQPLDGKVYTNGQVEVGQRRGLNRPV